MKKWIVLFLICAAAGCAAVFIPRMAVEQLLAPRPTVPVLPKSSFAWDSVQLQSKSYSLFGWFHAGEPSRPSLLLLHGLGENRASMFSRAEFFAHIGWSVLLIDLPCHGQSSGTHISLGVNESEAVWESYRFLRSRNPVTRIGVIGFSLGGASVILGDSIPPFDAVVLEALYSSVDQALENRMTMRFGILGRPLAYLMKCQLKPVLGVDSDRMHPIEAVKKLSSPVLIIGGENDQRTLQWETKALFESANNPKQLWIVSQAGHENYYDTHLLDYSHRVLFFLENHLNKEFGKEHRSLGGSMILRRENRKTE